MNKFVYFINNNHLYAFVVILNMVFVQTALGFFLLSIQSFASFSIGKNLNAVRATKDWIVVRNLMCVKMKEKQLANNMLQVCCDGAWEVPVDAHKNYLNNKLEFLFRFVASCSIVLFRCLSSGGWKTK